MKQYNVIYINNSTEIIEAYGCQKHGTNVTFDLGHGQTLHLTDVKYVEPLGEAV